LQEDNFQSPVGAIMIGPNSGLLAAADPHEKTTALENKRLQTPTLFLLTLLFFHDKVGGVGYQ
jgi:hypothetical protein